jgi:histidinol-phosphatase (PHP family)
MILTNYHTHSAWCDGEGAIADYAEKAVEKGFRALGFSAHAPLPFPNPWTLAEEEMPGYIADVQKCSMLYAEDLQIYLGLEVDYVKDIMAPSDTWLSSLGLDYLIGSVHMLRDPGDGRCYSVDGPEEEVRHLVNVTFGGGAEAMVRAYYQAVSEMIESGGFTFLGHFDLVRKLNGRMGLFDEGAPWYRTLVTLSLEKIAAAGIPVEMNTGAISRGYTTEPYPSDWIIPLCREMEIPVIINADAHKPEWIDHAFDLCRKTLRQAGYRETMMLLDGSWQSIPLD